MLQLFRRAEVPAQTSAAAVCQKSQGALMWHAVRLGLLGNTKTYCLRHGAASFPPLHM